MGIDLLEPEVPETESHAFATQQQLYSPAMLAELLSVSVRDIRRWNRCGMLPAADVVMQIPHFGYSEITIAKQLAKWTQLGLSISSMQRQLEKLQERAGGAHSVDTLPIVADGKRLVLRCGDSLIDADGQFQFGFGGGNEAQPPATVRFESQPKANEPQSQLRTIVSHRDLHSLEEMLDAAAVAEDDENAELAIDWYRAALAAFGPSPDVCFQLAEVLYRIGDLAGARERYFMALELEPALVEARANLGCVLAEQGQLELAIAAFDGALAQYADYADVHFHLARVLEDAGQSTRAAEHWQAFLDLAPASPWADEAREQLKLGSPLLDF